MGWRITKVKSLSPVRLSMDFPSKSIGVGCHFLLQRIFPTQGWNPGLPHCKQMILPSEPQGKLHTWVRVPIYISLICHQRWSKRNDKHWQPVQPAPQPWFWTPLSVKGTRAPWRNGCFWGWTKKNKGCCPPPRAQWWSGKSMQLLTDRHPRAI